MSDKKRKTPPYLRLVGTPPVQESFEPVSAPVRTEKFPSARELKYFTINEAMRELLDAFQTAKEYDFAVLNIYHNRESNELEYSPIETLDEASPQEPNHVFTFKLSTSFEEQFPLDLIKRIKSVEDILITFDEIERDNGTIIPEVFMPAYPPTAPTAPVKIKQNPYSEKFQLLEKKFKEVKKINKPRNFSKPLFCYILVDEQGQLDHVVNELPHSTSAMQQALDSTGTFPNMKVVAAFNLHEDSFESQLRACGFNPTQNVTWEDLKARPADCVSGVPKPIKRTVVPFRQDP